MTVDPPQPRKRAGASSIVWLLVLLAAILVVMMVGAMSRARSVASADSTDSAAATAAVALSQSHAVSPEIMAELENIPDFAWQEAGMHGASAPAVVGDGDTVGSKAEVLYIGAGYCPYCAAARWSMVTALSRFGKFSDLSLGRSSASDVYPNTPTFSFHQSSYTSPYVTFEPVEEAGNVEQPDGKYNPLEKPTAAQQALLQKYDAPPYVSAQDAGGIPFILIGDRFMWDGSPFDPGLLAGKSQAAIAATLAHASGDAADAILSNANVITATICAVDGGSPTEVCSTSVIQSVIHALPRSTP